MKIVSFNGSPRGKKSNTHVMIDALEQGLRTRTEEIHDIFLSEKEIRYCKGCHTCWTATPGVCAIDDDMKDIIGLMRDADVFIFGSPLFFNNVSGNLKVFFDRLTAAGGDPQAKQSAVSRQIVPHIVMVSNCGFPYRTQFEALSIWIGNVARMMQAPLIGEFYTTNGNALTSPADEERAPRERYLEYLERCGAELAKGFALTDESRSLLAKNILEF
jgi:multimeric flavodoxin WrbA